MKNLSSTFKTGYKKIKERRQRRELRNHKKVRGTAEKPRLAINRTTKHFYAQIINDENGNTLASASSVDKELKGKLKHGGNISASKVVAELLANRCLKNNIKTISFDKSGYKYHGRVKIFADVLREKGLKF